MRLDLQGTTIDLVTSDVLQICDEFIGLKFLLVSPETF